MKAADIKQIRGNEWNTEFDAQDILEVFGGSTPMEMVYHGATFSLAWFVAQVFRNQQGKPLRLEAFQQVMLDMLWYKKFPMVLATRGAGKTFILAVYALLKALLIPGSKIVIVGSGFRQAKLVFKYIEQLYNASPIVQEAVGQGERPKYGSDAATLQVGLSTISAIPIGDGSKIRGMRATTLIADEFASISEEIFEIVIKPFTAVHANPAERAENRRFIHRLRKLGAAENIVAAIESTQGFGNQVVISGTPSYRHNHFYKRYSVYKMFIQSRGDTKKLKKVLEEKQLAMTGRYQEADIDDLEQSKKTWFHYAIYQLPYTAMPEGFLDDDMINADRAEFAGHRFAMEYLAQFPEDSDGFIRRSWIERSTPRHPNGEPVWPELYGDPRGIYVMGLDPARWNDNFGCVVLRLTERGKELVYCNAWDKTQYSESAEKIREIARRFKVSYICMDAGGGGESVREWLCKKQEGIAVEELIWVIPDQIPKYGEKTDLSAPGRKVLEMVDFSPNWISRAAHDVEASVEQCNILFPDRGDDGKAYDQYMRHFGKNKLSEREMEMLQGDLWGVDDWDAERMSTAYKDKSITPRLGIMDHIMECVNETCAIVRSVSPKGTESFELPRLGDQPEGLDMRRRDRWSALMLANYAAKVYQGAGFIPTNRTRDNVSNRKTRRYTGQRVNKRGSVSW